MSSADQPLSLGWSASSFVMWPRDLPTFGAMMSRTPPNVLALLNFFGDGLSVGR